MRPGSPPSFESHASPDFWTCYHSLPTEIQQFADRAYDLLKRDPRHPSLRLKKVDRYRFVRMGDHYRALAVEAPDGLVWFWIQELLGHKDVNTTMIYTQVLNRCRRGVDSAADRL